MKLPVMIAHKTAIEIYADLIILYGKGDAPHVQIILEIIVIKRNSWKFMKQMNSPTTVE